MLDRLKEIFNYYKGKYKLKTKLLFKSNEDCCFYPETNWINYDLNYVIKEANNRIIRQLTKQYGTKKIIPIFALLHELGHAIDLKHNNKQYQKESLQLDWFLYNSDGKYAISQPFEKRANKFARRELKKWIKC